MKPTGALLVVIAGLALGGGCGPNRAVHRPSSPDTRETDTLSRWETALRKDPDRLDARLQLARLYRDRGDFEAEYGLWASSLQLADKPSHHYHWENGGPPPQRPSRSIASNLQKSIDHEMALGTEEGTARALRLSKLGATYFPNQASFERSRALCYSRRGDPKAAMKCLLRLLNREPDSPATLLDIGLTLRDAGKPREARLYFQKVRKLGVPGEPLEKAEQELREN